MSTLQHKIVLLLAQISVELLTSHWWNLKGTKLQMFKGVEVSMPLYWMLSKGRMTHQMNGRDGILMWLTDVWQPRRFTSEVESFQISLKARASVHVSQARILED